MSTKTKHISAGVEIERSGEAPSITITTGGVDYMKDRLDPDGADWTRFMAGTRAVNYGHDHSHIESIVGRTESLVRSGRGWRAMWTWLDTPSARLVRQAFEASVLAASVELIPDEYEPNADGGVDITKW